MHSNSIHVDMWPDDDIKIEMYVTIIVMSAEVVEKLTNE